MLAELEWTAKGSVSFHSEMPSVNNDFILISTVGKKRLILKKHEHHEVSFSSSDLYW